MEKTNLFQSVSHHYRKLIFSLSLYPSVLWCSTCLLSIILSVNVVCTWKIALNVNLINGSLEICKLRTTPSAVNNLIDNLFERKYRNVGQEKNTLGFFSRRVFCFNIVLPGRRSKYREFPDQLGRITCMSLLFTNAKRRFSYYMASIAQVSSVF